MEKTWKLTRSSGLEIIDKLREAAIGGIIFLVPLWFDFLLPTDNVFELNKMAIFRIGVWILLFLTVLRYAIRPLKLPLEPSRFFRRYWLAPVIFIGGTGLLLAFSIDPQRSFFGLLDRQQGYSSLLYYFLWFLLSGTYLAEGGTRARLYRYAATAALSGVIVAVYGILQFAGIDFRDWQEPAYLTHRTFSALGQPNFLGSWLLLVLPLAAYLSWRSSRVWSRSLWAAGFFLQLVCLFLTGSRGAFLGLGLVFLIAAAAWIGRSGFSRRQKAAAAGGAVILMALILVALDTVSGGRVRELRRLDYGSLGARFYIYEAAYSAWQEKPWFGYGLDNQKEALISYYRPDWAVYGDVGQNADRAHNLVLDILLTGGLAGLALSAVLAVYAIYLSRACLKKGGGLPVAIILGSGAYFVSLLVSFSFVAGEVYAWFFLGILTAWSAQGSPDKQPEAAASALNPAIYIAPALAFGLAFLGIREAARSVTADHYFRQSYAALAQEDYFTAAVLDSYLAEQDPSPIARAAYDTAWASVLSQTYDSVKELAPRYLLKAKLEEIDSRLPDRGYERLLARARTSRLLQETASADDFLGRVISQAPFWPTAYLEQAQLRLAQSDPVGAMASLDMVLERLPELGDKRPNQEHRDKANFYRYLVYRQAGDISAEAGNHKGALASYLQAYQANPGDYALLKKIADSYYLQNDLATAVAYVQHGYSRNPDSAAWPLALSAIYYEQGDDIRGRQYLDEALRLDPDNEQLRQLDREHKE